MVRMRTCAAPPTIKNTTPRNMAYRESERLLDAEFVEGPAEDWECPVCKLNLLQPSLLSCCGNHLCHSCVKKLEGRPCPLCSAPFTAILDKGRQRAIWQAKVHCPNRESGCEWQGELRDLLRHLEPADGEGGESPGVRGRIPLCQFEAIPCGNEGCDLRLPRKDAEQHQRHECPHRKVVCQYCNVVETTYQEMTAVHWGECPDFPVSCPNNCDTGEMRRSQVQSHCDRDCKLQLVKCPYFDLGCAAKQRPRKELQNHVNTTQLYHGQLLVRKIVEMQLKQEAVVTKEELEKMTGGLQEQIQQRDEVIQKLSTEADKFTKFVEDTDARFVAMHVEFEAKLTAKDEELKEKETKIASLERELKENGEKLGKVEAELGERLADVEKIKEENESLEKQLKESSEKVKTELSERLADVEKQQATRLEEIKKAMEEMKEELGGKEKQERKNSIREIEEKLTEQIEKRQPKDDFENLENRLADLTKQVQDNEDKVAAKMKEITPKRSLEEEKRDLKTELIASVEQTLDERLKALKEALKAEHNTEIEERKAAEEKILAKEKEDVEKLQNEVETIREEHAEMREGLEEEVEEVKQHFEERVEEVMKEVNYIEKAATPTPPFSFTVSRFTKRREKKDSFVSEPFYTSRRGYRMVVRVDAAGTDTHVSVWCCITRGQHDDIIPWPLRADIFIRLINQREKDKFYERQISYDNVARDKHAGRVVTGDKNYLWGLREFITLREIQSGQYLVGDALDFVVHRVELKEMDREIGGN